MEAVGKFYGHLIYFTAFWYPLWPFGIFGGYLVYYSPRWYVALRKIWQPWAAALALKNAIDRTQGTNWCNSVSRLQGFLNE
jgi:hypothetical protein